MASEAKSKMFEFVTSKRERPTWNPIVLYPCPHGCTYCWVPEVVKKFNIKRYLQARRPTVLETELRRTFHDGDLIFVCDMCDMLAWEIPVDFIFRVFNRIKDFPKSTFLILTKNTRRLYSIAEHGGIPQNCIVGSTIESNRNYPHYSHAPSQTSRIRYMQMLYDYRPLFWSIEPIFDFDLDVFAGDIISTKPWGVAVGYDNYRKLLPEPPLRKTMQLIEKLRAAGIQVWEKTIRESWKEAEAKAEVKG